MKIWQFWTPFLLVWFSLDIFIRILCIQTRPVFISDTWRLPTLTTSAPKKKKKHRKTEHANSRGKEPAKSATMSTGAAKKVFKPHSTHRKSATASIGVGRRRKKKKNPGFLLLCVDSLRVSGAARKRAAKSLSTSAGAAKKPRQPGRRRTRV